MELEEFEGRAGRVLDCVPAYVWDGDQLPVPVERIVSDVYGLRVLHKAGEEMCKAPGCPEVAPGQSLSGLLLASRGEIWVNADEAAAWPGRGRFTICHELGHWVMHRHAGEQSLFCRATKPPAGHDAEPAAPGSAEPRPERNIEDEASAFAAALLIPRELLRREYARVREFEFLRDRFASSGSAMGRRLHQVI